MEIAYDKFEDLHGISELEKYIEIYIKFEEFDGR